MQNLIFFISFLIFSIIVAVGIIVTSLIVSYKKRNKIKSSTYECGLIPKTSTRIKFNIKYYRYVIIFLFFDILAIFLFPILAVGDEYSKSHSFIILSFLLIIFLILLRGRKLL